VDLPTALVAIIAVAVIAYIVTVVHVATTRTLARRTEGYRPEERLLAWPKWLTALVAGLAVIWFLYRVRQILLPFVVGAIIAYLLNPVIDRLERRGWSRIRAIWFVFGLFLLVFLLAAFGLVPALAGEARDLIASYEQVVARGHELAREARAWAQNWGLALGVLPEDVASAFSAVGDKAQSYGLSLLEGVLSWLNRSVIIVSLLILTPVVTFWVLRDYHLLGQRLLKLMPERQRTATLAILHDINRVAGGYLLGMVTMMVIVGIFAVAVLSIAGVHFAWLLGIVTGVLYVIPYLGYPTAMVVVTLTMAITGKPPGAILAVLAILISGNIAFDYGVTPRVLGGRVGLHPLVVIFSVLAGAALFGVLGVIISIPLAGAIKVVLLHFWPEAFSAHDQQDAPSS